MYFSEKDSENWLWMCYSKYIHIKALSDMERSKNIVGEDALMI